MKISRNFLIIVTSLILLLISIKPSLAWSDWLCLKTEHFKVFYKPGHEMEARQVLEALEYYRPRIEKLCGNEVSNFSVVIDDAGTLGSGFTNPVNSASHLFRYSPELWATENWWSLVGTHEYLHGLSLTNIGGVPGRLTDLFGNWVLFMPNLLTPGWVREGITVYGESQLTPYQGRLNDGFYDAYIGARVAADRFPSIIEATYQPFEYPLGDGFYIYGGEFFNYLAKTYGETVFAQFYTENGSNPGSLVPFLPKIGLDRSAERVFGKTFPQLWEEWRDYETERFKDFQMEGRQVTKTGWGLKYPKIWEGKLYYQQGYYRNKETYKCSLMELDPVTGKERKILSNMGFGAPLKIKNGKLYYTMQAVKTGFDNASLRSYGTYIWLREFDLARKKGKTILKDLVRAFEILDDGKIIYSKDRSDGFGSELYLKEPDAKAPSLLFRTDYLVGELEISDGRIITVARQDWETFSIFTFNLETGEFAPLIDTPYLEFGISVQDEKLFFSANYQRKLSSYCYDFTTSQIYRLTENGLAIYPTYDEHSNQLYYVGINANGYDIYCQSADFKEFQLPETQATAPPVFDLPEAEISRGSYQDNLKTLAPRFWMPLINSDEQKIGVYFGGGDVIMDFPKYFGNFGYSYEREDYFGSLDLDVNYFAPLQTTLTYEKDDDDGETNTKLTMEYPFFSVVKVGASLGVDPDYDGLETAPFIELGPLTASAPKSRLKNGDEREAFYARLKMRHKLLGGKLVAVASYIDDPQNPDSVFREIRGYDDELKAGKGRIYTFEYSHLLQKIQKGCWNPNIYFEDLTIKLFNDRAVSDSGSKQESWGLELHFETKAGFMIPLNWGCRYVRNKDDDAKVELFIKDILKY